MVPPEAADLESPEPKSDFVSCTDVVRQYAFNSVRRENIEFSRMRSDQPPPKRNEERRKPEDGEWQTVRR